MRDKEGEKIIVSERNNHISASDSTNEKIMYLEQEKNFLEIEFNELKANNDMLRKINLEIATQNNCDESQALKLNRNLQDLYCQMSKTNRQLRTNIFLAFQISAETQRDYKEIMENYQ